jgi:glycosyltransferase involved in cell wall biosynthesis
MRVLLTHEYFAPDFAGGGEYIVLEMARNLLRKGVEVKVLTTGDPAQDNYDGIRVIRLPIHRFRLNFAVWKIAALAEECDLIQTCTYHASFPSLIAGRWTGKPVICLVLGLFQDAWKPMHGAVGGAFRIAWEKFLLRREFARLVFLSDYSREIGIALGAAKERSVVNAPGLYLENYSPATQKEDIVLFAGKLDVRKGITEFLQIARELPSVRFQAMGWGPDADALRCDATGNVEFLGFLSGPALYRAFARARVCVLPSKAETFGVAMVEAMASGCAIVSSIALPFEGVRTGAGDVPAMVRAVQDLLAQPDKTQEMGNQNAQLARAYTWENSVNRMIDIYRQALRQ